MVTSVSTCKWPEVNLLKLVSVLYIKAEASFSFVY